MVLTNYYLPNVILAVTYGGVPDTTWSGFSPESTSIVIGSGVFWAGRGLEWW